MSRRRRLPSSLKAGEVDAILKTAASLRDQAKTPKAKRRAWRNQLLILTGLLMGLRVSELCKLCIEHIDFEASAALISLAKGGKDRTVPVPSKLAPQLVEWIGDRRAGYVFAAPGERQLSTRAVQTMVEHLGRAAGLTKRLKPHTLRHTYATKLLRTGADIMEIKELLGHSSVATTMVYLSCETSRLKTAVDRL